MPVPDLYVSITARVTTHIGFQKIVCITAVLPLKG